MVEDYVPRRGDVVWLDFSPQLGHEQAGRRPALVLSPASYNGKVGLMLACPLTNRSKGYPFEVALPRRSRVTGVVQADQLKSVDWRARRADFLGRVSEAMTQTTLNKVLALLRD